MSKLCLFVYCHYVMSVQQRPRYLLHCSLFAKIIKILETSVLVVLVTSILLLITFQCPELIILGETAQPSLGKEDH